MHVPGMICGCMSLEGDGEKRKCPSSLSCSDREQDVLNNCLTFDIVECFSTLLQFWHLPETEFGNLPFQWSRIRHSSSHSFYFEEAMILECIYMANYFDSNQMMKFHCKLAHWTWLCCLLHPMVFLAEFLGSSVTRTPQFAAVRHILYG